MSSLAEPGEGEVVVRVKAAGINPGEAEIREGLLARALAGDVPLRAGQRPGRRDRRGRRRRRGIRVGDEVIGFTHDRASQAELVVVDAQHVTPRPGAVSWEAAGALFVAGATAYAAVRAVAPAEGDVLAVSGAAGGVGTLAVQLARNAGATVIGIAGEHHHDWLREHGAIPVTYGDGLAERIRDAAGSGGLDAFIDTFGSGYVELAIELGVAPQRIDTIIDWDAAERHGVKTDANMAGASADTLAELARLIAEGRLEVPIARVYPLTEVRAAYRELERRHTLGKIVLAP